MKLESYRQILEKYSDLKSHQNPSSGSRVVPCGQTDRRDEANTRFSKFYERAQKLTVTQRARNVTVQELCCW
jgi:hypothetical protein